MEPMEPMEPAAKFTEMRGIAVKVKAMPKLGSYETQIKAAMKSAGIYDKKFTFQIKICANSMRLLDKMQEEFEKQDVYIEKFSRGDVAVEINPIVASIQKQNSLVTEQLTALGLNFKAKASNIKESVGAPEDGGLVDFMQSFK